MNTAENNTSTKIMNIMSKDVEIVSSDTTLNDVAQKMQRRDSGCVLVTKGARVIGMITDRDLAIRYVAESKNAAERTAAQVMSSDILYCLDTDEADDVTKIMGQNKVRRLAVLDLNNQLVGIVTLGDLASHSNHVLCGEVLGEICHTRQSPHYNKH
jgi:CBS domain-containing protein